MSEVIVVKDEEALKEAIEFGNIAVWDGNDHLYKILNKILKKMDKKAIINMKVCREIRYEKGVTVKKSAKDLKVQELSTLLKQVSDFNDKVTIIIESNKISEVLETIQQLIYLGLQADVYTREELLKRAVVDEYYKKVEELHNTIEVILNSLKGYEIEKEQTRQRKTEVTEVIEDIRKNIEQSFDKTIKVAVFATKKSGKSMIINALLEDEYAPTSLELATPTVIEYKPYQDSKHPNEIKLEYKLNDNEDYIVEYYNSADKIKSEIEKIFETVNLGGKKLPPMRIYYPQRKGINYEIFDTPGPDLAGSQHGDFMEEYIEKSDVVVFAIDYSKHAQEAEVELLKSIKNSFEKLGKSYSLICALNKIDLMFSDSNTENNITRAADFIYHKMEELGFNDFIIIPISAMVGFYAQKIKDVYKDITKNDLDETNLLQDITNLSDEILDNPSKYKDIPREVETYLDTLINTLGSIKRNYNIKRPTYNDLMNWCNFPYLEEYIQYVAEKKAVLEKTWSIIQQIENNVTRIRNYINMNGFLKLELEEIRRALEDFLSNNVNEEDTKKSLEYAFEMFYKEIMYIVEDLIKIISQNLAMHVDRSLVHKEYLIKNRIYSYLSRYQNKIYDSDEISIFDKLNPYTGLTDEEIEKIHKEIGMILNDINNYEDKELDSMIKNIYEHFKYSQNTIEKMTEEIKKYIENIRINIMKNINELRDKLKKEFNYDVFIELPTFPIDLGFLLIDLDKILGNNLREKLKDIKIHKISIEANKYDSLLIFKRYKISKSDIDKTINNIFSEIRNEFNKMIESIFKDIQIYFYRDIKIEKEIENSMNESKKLAISYIDSVYKPVGEIKKELEMETSTKEDIYNFFNWLNEQIKPFNDVWSSIIKNYRYLQGE